MNVNDDYDDKRDLALSLLLRAEALTTCRVHGEVIDGPKDVQGAYKLAMHR